MIKKTIFQLLLFNFLLVKKVFAAESGGMPQLNPEFWISQIFWLTLTFGVLYVVLSKLILPKISSNLELRKSQIQENIEAAEKHRENGESKLREYNDIILKSKTEAKNIFKDAREKVIKDINSKKETLDKQINQEIKNAEEEIELLKKSVPEKINKEIESVENEINQLRKDAPVKITKIAIETASELTQKLIGAEVNNSSISAIVDDLSKRSGDKYYGN